MAEGLLGEHREIFGNSTKKYEVLMNQKEPRNTYGAPIVNLLFVANIVIFEWFIWLYEITRLVRVNTQCGFIK